jgi:hypothetical protein
VLYCSHCSLAMHSTTPSNVTCDHNQHLLLQLDDAKEIFGEGIIDFFREQRGDAADAMDIDAVGEDGNRLQQQQPKRRLKAAASATAGIEPAVLREHFLEKTDLDIQAKDK